MLRSHRREIVYEPSPPSTFLTFAIPFLLLLFKALSGRGGTFVLMSILMKSYLIQIIIFHRVLIQTGTAS